MIPRVRLTYVHGLATLHEELRAPRDVELTTDGTSLVICPPGSGRPLAKLPLDLVSDVALQDTPLPDTTPLVTSTALASRLLRDGSIIALRFSAGAGIPASIAGQPLLFVETKPGAGPSALSAAKNLLTPRSPLEMARLERGQRRHHAYLTLVVLAVGALLAATVVALLVQALGPRSRQSAGDGPTPCCIATATASASASASDSS